jgi:hypothetical protein
LQPLSGHYFRQRGTLSRKIPSASELSSETMTFTVMNEELSKKPSHGYSATGKRSRIVRPRTLFKQVRSCMTFIPADWHTNDKSTLFSNRYRSASRLGRNGVESQS